MVEVSKFSEIPLALLSCERGSIMRPSNGTSNGADGSTIMLLAISIDESYIDGVQNVFFVFAIVAVPFTIIVTGSSLPSVIPPKQGCPCGCRPRWIAIRR